MKKCPYCAEEIQDEANKCKHCNEFLTITKTSNLSICPKCKKEYDDSWKKCLHCGVDLIKSDKLYTVSSQKMITNNPKNPGVALILSFFMPGLGQFYNEQIGKGFLFLILFWVLVWTIIGGIIIWIIGLVDAFNSAKNFNLSPS